VRAAWHRVAVWLQEEAGAQVVSVSLPNTSHALPAYYILAPAEAMSNLARYDGVRSGYAHAAAQTDEAAARALAAGQPPPPKSVDQGPPAQGLREYYTMNRSFAFGPEVQRRILVGSFVLSSRAVEGFYQKAQRIRRAITADFMRCFREQGVDVLLTPTCVGTALSFGAIRRESSTNAVAPYLNDLFTIPSNLAGIPAISVPAAMQDGLPIGLQLLGDYHSEGRLLDVASWIHARAKLEGVNCDLAAQNERIMSLSL
jgi:aspartyl-tRNA(Asn)/glutamyl-tRNA(Gln) amidotransferase subunit A